MIDYSLLNEVQKQASMDTEGSVLVFAGAGSGKTRVLTTRIAHIIEDGLAYPYQVLAITFTNKAANEMKERLTKLVGETRDMWICTIHGMCNRILRRDIDKIGYDKNFTIYTDTERDRLLKDIIGELQFDEEIFKDCRFHISNAKAQNISPEKYEKQNGMNKHIFEICQVFRAYESELMKRNCLDFDDLLTKTYVLLSTNEETRNKYSEKFKYIHIDEFQDTNDIQYDIIKLLYKNHGNLFAVGDDDQSIYGFRGANVKNILRFEKDFPNSKIYKLEQNYRSTKKILEIANAIISKNVERAPKELWCEKDEGEKIVFKSCFDEQDEGQYVANSIRSLVNYNGYKYSDIAVIYRINALSRSFEQEFMKYNVPYKIFGGLKFFDRKEIKDLTAYLRALVNPKDVDAYKRIINVPKRGIGETTVNKLMAICDREDKLLLSVLADIDNYPEFNQGTKTKLKNFYDIMVSLYNEVSILSPIDFVNQVIERTNFRLQYAEKSEENIQKNYNIDEYLNSLHEFAEENEGADVSEFLQSVTLSSAIDNYQEIDDTVTLATVHAVKGLEFKVVFVIGLDEKYFPIVRPDSRFEDLEEERRLMYVAVTRAEKRLFLTRAESRYSFYMRQRIHMVRSRFIEDVKDIIGIKEKIEKLIKEEPKPKFEFRGASILTAKPVQAQETTSGKSGFKIGDRVSHPKFGEGNVVAAKGAGESEVLDIAFKGFGIKSLALKYAPIKKI